MESVRFDRIVKALGTYRTRRGTLALLAVPGLAGAVVATDAGAKKKRKKKKKKCKPKPQATTCAGKCGAVKNNCQKSVTCGSCPTGQCCSGNGACGACLVFVTSTTFWGDLDGLDGADARCQERADAADLPGAYKAWLSDDTSSPSTRFVQATVPYTLVDGTTIAANWAALTSGTLAHAIDQTETGGSVSSPENAWTYTEANGTAGGIEPDAHCQNWTSSIGGPTDVGTHGRATFSDAQWTEFALKECNTDTLHLYCFQQS